MGRVVEESGIPAPNPAGAELRWWSTGKWQAFLAVGGAFFAVVLSFAMVFVLLAPIAEEFDVTLRLVGWVVIIDALIVSALVLPLGAIADVVGRRRVLMAGLLVFGLGAVFSGLAPTFGLLIGARIFMAFGNALIQAVATGMLVAAFPADERGLALGAQTTAVACGSAAGPLIAGFALALMSWRTLFVLMAIPVVLTLVTVWAVIDTDETVGGRRLRSFDWIGALLAGLSVVLLVGTIANPLGMGWTSWPLVLAAALTVVTMAGFIRWELARSDPMLELRLFSIPMFRLAVLIRLVGFIGGAAANLLIPIFLVSVRGSAEGAAGIVLFFLALGIGIAAQISGRLFDRLGPRIPTVVGLTVQATSALALASADENTSVVFIGAVVFVAGLGVALWNVANNSAMMAATPATHLGVGGAFTNVTRTVGSVVGQAVLASLVAGVMAAKRFDIPLGDIVDTPGAGDAFIDGWRVAYIVVAIISGVLLIPALRLPHWGGQDGSRIQA